MSEKTSRFNREKYNPYKRFEDLSSGHKKKISDDTPRATRSDYSLDNQEVKRIIILLQELNMRVTALENECKKMGFYLRETRQSKVEEVDFADEDELHESPLRNVQEFLAFEEEMKTNFYTRKQFENLIEACRCPESIRQYVHKVMRRLMTNELAVEYSWMGRSRGQCVSGKRGGYTTRQFAKTTTCRAIVDYIVEFEETNIGTVKKHISNWLNNSRKRLNSLGPSSASSNNSNSH